MDFQSAARFGERRVMVTDYDETAVEVNAKVVDEDTGEVICECESGGGGGESDFSEAIVTLGAGAFSPAIQLAEVVDYVDEEYPEDNYSGIVAKYEAFTRDERTIKIVLYKGHQITSYEGAPTISGTGSVTIVHITDNLYQIDITGDCTLTVS